MEFLITRTSNCIDEEMPVKNCYKKQFDIIETRTLKNFEEFDNKFAKRQGKWLEKGVNHRINKQGFIERTISNGGNGWFIKIESLNELIEFCKTYGEIIIKNTCGNINITEIEIYDDYRE